MQRTTSGAPAAASLDDLIDMRREILERVNALMRSDGVVIAAADDPADLAAAAERLYEDWCASTPADDSGFASEALTALLHQLYDIDHAILSLTDGEPI